MAKSRVGNSHFGFLCESLVFLTKKSKKLFLSLSLSLFLFHSFSLSLFSLFLKESEEGMLLSFF